jgi:hypothetical protein
MQTFTYEFEELPLVIAGGIEAGLINGQAQVDYSRDSFEIGQITLEGFGQRVNGKRQWPQVLAPDAIANIVRQRLDNEWYDKVYTAFVEQLASDREDAAEQRADHARDLRKHEVV